MTTAVKSDHSSQSPIKTPMNWCIVNKTIAKSHIEKKGNKGFPLLTPSSVLLLLTLKPSQNQIPQIFFVSWWSQISKWYFTPTYLIMLKSFSQLVTSLMVWNFIVNLQISLTRDSWWYRDEPECWILAPTSWYHQTQDCNGKLYQFY